MPDPLKALGGLEDPGVSEAPVVSTILHLDLPHTPPPSRPLADRPPSDLLKGLLDQMPTFDPWTPTQSRPTLGVLSAFGPNGAPEEHPPWLTGSLPRLLALSRPDPRHARCQSIPDSGARLESLPACA